jgi:hypothetical protein
LEARLRAEVIFGNRSPEQIATGQPLVNAKLPSCAIGLGHIRAK